jgi:tripartite-type tricarboxylate transporter receptor subunit TctC
MKTRREFLTTTSSAAAAAGLAGLSVPAFAQQGYPSGDLHFICSFPPGTGPDLITRYFAEKVRPLANCNIVVENRPGQRGILAIGHVVRAKPDGHTIFVHAGSAVASSMSVFKNPPTDAAKTIQVAATISRLGFMLIVAANSPYQTLADLTAAMKEKGPKASYASSTQDGLVMGELYKAATGIQAVEVHYKQVADSLNDLLGGQIDYTFGSTIFSLPLAKAGRIRILGISTGTRLASVPDVPTMTEQGVPMDLTAWFAAMVRQDTPRPIVEQIHQWFSQVVRTEETRKFINGIGNDTFDLGIDDAQANLLKDIDNWREYVRVARIQAE